MKSKKNLLEQLKSLPHLTKHYIPAWYAFGVKRSCTVDTYISRFLNTKKLYSLKRGCMYLLTDFFEKNKMDISYSFYLANIIRTPSYVSSWAALHYYNLASGSNLFYYINYSQSQQENNTRQKRATSHIIQSKRSFSDFLWSMENLIFTFLHPSKALFDLLYFRTKPVSWCFFGKYQITVEELRIDIDEMDKTEQKKFYENTKNLYERTNTQKFKKQT